MSTNGEDAPRTEDTESGGKRPGRPRKELPGLGDNMSGLIPAIEKAFSEIGELGKNREAINKKVQAIRETLYSNGVPKEAFDLARNYSQWPEDKRRNFDLAFAVCRKAIGMPMQSDFLDKIGDAEGDG